MPHAHGHTHTSDKWTKLSATWGFSNNYASTTYLIASLIDLFKGLDGTTLGVSWYGFGIGASLALLPAVGSTYATYVLNKNYETRSLEEAGQDKGKLSYVEYAALATAYLGYSLQSAGAVKGIIDLIAKDKIPMRGMIAIYSIVALGAFVGSYANIRTYKTNMQSASSETMRLLSSDKPNKKSDLWTKLGVGWEVFTSYQPTLYFFASLVDLIAGLKGTDLNLSWYGLVVGGILGAFPTAGSAYSHYILNKKHQHADPKSMEPGREGLTCHEKSALVGDWFGHALQSAGVANALIALFSKNNLSFGWKFTVYSLTTACAFFGTYANVRTCGNNMLGKNQEETPIGLNQT